MSARAISTNDDLCVLPQMTQNVRSETAPTASGVRMTVTNDSHNRFYDSLVLLRPILKYPIDIVLSNNSLALARLVHVRPSLEAGLYSSAGRRRLGEISIVLCQPWA